MSKLKPKQFDEYLREDFEWDSNCSRPKDWKNISFIGEYNGYYLYYAHDNDGLAGFVYRTKIENVGEEKSKEQIMEIDGKKYKLVEVKK